MTLKQEFYEAEKRVEELKDLINYHNDLYYNQDNPEITDYEYDMLVEELKKLEAKFPELRTDDSPTNKVGGEARDGMEKIVHSTKTLSLDNVFDKESLYNFIRKAENQLGSPIEWVVEKKIDGLTARLVYGANGKMEYALSRGNGEIGENIIATVQTIKEDIPKVILYKLPRLEVRGEVYMTFEGFNRVNEQQLKKGKNLYQNPRNLAAGTIRNLDAKVAEERGLNFFAFNVEVAEGMEFETHSELLEWLKMQGFAITPNYKICKNADEVWEAICEIEENRSSLPYPIDGVVIKANSLKVREVLKETSKYPRWACAFKFEAEKKVGICKTITTQVGRTGKLTPVAIFEEPIRLNDTDVTRATLHNFSEVKRLGIAPGSHCLVMKAGEIIPSIIAKVPSENDSSIIPYEIPDKCPVCGSSVSNHEGGVDLYCDNPLCDAKVSRSISYFVSSSAMDISGLGPSTIEALLEHGYIKDISDIYYLDKYKEELIQKGVVGKQKSVTNMLEAIEKSKENEFYKLLSGLGISNIGRRASKALQNKFESIDELIDANYEDIVSIPEFGDKMALAIVDFFKVEKNIEILEKLKNKNVNMISPINKIYKLFTKIGISGINEKDSKILANKFKTIEEIEKSSIEELSRLPKFNNAKASSLKKFFESSQWNKIKEQGVDTVFEEEKDLKFEGMTFVITGTLPSLKREEAKLMVEKLGGKVGSSVSKKTSFLLAGEKAGSKLDKAVELGVTIIDEEEFRKMVGC